jgi:tetratricopeptide (TPR) repeat protein
MPKEMLRRGFIGVEFDQSAESQSGARIASVLAGGSADEAGIRAGDILFRIDGEAITSADDALSMAKGWKPNQAITVHLRRDGQEVTTKVRLMSAHRYVELRSAAGPNLAAAGQAEQFYTRGTELLDSDPERAIAYLTRSLELAPDAPPALYNRAAAYARVGRDSEGRPKIGPRC